MPAYVAGFSRLASVVAGSLSTHRGMTLWYGLMGVRLVALFVADRPWDSLRTDFICNGSVSPYCWANCFNRHFDFPMDVLWDFSYILAALPVFCLYQLAQGRRPVAPEEPLSPQALGRAGGCWPWGSAACALALATIEGAFLWLLLRVQLPLAAPGPALCLSPACPQPVVCGLFAQAEKLGALAVLGFASALNILASLAYIGATCLAVRRGA
ncbi:uncharacterized protein LOC121274824 isoform X2 [Carcharodon carcharias]|nr:uncharacterized protein LOC121274824 isoform X2 [Carcharodon carcharias]